MIPSIDIRQDDKWADYLKTYGWSSHKTSRGINIFYLKNTAISVVKIQHPNILEDKDIVEIEEFCKTLKPLFIKIEPFLGQDETLLEKKGYLKSNSPLSPPSTIYMDLTKSEEELWNSLSHSAKYSIKRAQREGTVTRFYQNPLKEKIEPYFEVLKKTGRRKHFIVLPVNDIFRRVKIYGKECHLVLSYDKEGDLLSGKFYLCSNDVVLYSSGGTSEKGLKTKAGYDLLWKSLLYFKGLGYKVLDLEGKDDSRYPDSTKTWGGFSHFKEKFGGQDIEFPYSYIKYISPVFKILSKFFKLPL